MTPAPAALLSSYTNLLRDGAAGTGELERSLGELARLFEALTEEVAADRSQALPCGEALAPRDAARCLRDTLRTSCFHRGIRDGLEALLAVQRERPLHVVYAGCGPFAALVVPLMHLFQPQDVQFHLWEVSGAALEHCRRLVARLGLEAWVAECRQGDATRWERPAFPVHMIVIEAIQAALETEPQVALAAHLAPWLEPGGLLIPERVRVIATLLDPAREFGPASERVRRDLGVVFELDRERATRIGGGLGHGEARAEIPAGWITIPLEAPGERELWLRTQVQVFGQEQLDDHDSGLTVPRPAPLTSRAPPGAEVAFRYVLGPDPGLRCAVTGLEVRLEPWPGRGTRG